MWVLILKSLWDLIGSSGSSRLDSAGSKSTPILSIDSYYKSMEKRNLKKNCELREKWRDVPFYYKTSLQLSLQCITRGSGLRMSHEENLNENFPLNI